MIPEDEAILRSCRLGGWSHVAVRAKTRDPTRGFFSTSGITYNREWHFSGGAANFRIF